MQAGREQPGSGLGGGGLLAEEFLLDDLGEDVANQRVAFLDAGSFVGWHADAFLDDGTEFAAGTTGQANGDEVGFVGGGDSMQNVR